MKRWEEQDLWLKIWRTFLSQLDTEGALDWQEAFIDASFAPAKKGGSRVGETKRGKGSKWMVVVDGQSIPLGGTISSASPAEVKLAEETLETIKVPRRGRGRPKSRPKRLIGDKDYDSDKLWASLAGEGIRLLVPCRKNRKDKKTSPEVEERYQHR